MKYYAIAVIFISILLAAVALQFAFAGRVATTTTTSITTKMVTQTGIPNITRPDSTTSVITNTTFPRTGSPINNTLLFNEGKALNYFLSLNTSTGLLTDFHGDSIIYLSDDQPLDYNALMDIHASTQNRTALRLATQIIDTMTKEYGSLYRFWNEIFVLFGQYPSASVWNVTGGANQVIKSDGSYHILSTIFPLNNNTKEEVQQYVDIALYYAIWNAIVANIGGSGGNLTAAFGTFSKVQSNCVNYGCFDCANLGQASAYQSYKVALDLLAYKELFKAGAFRMANPQVMTTINETINRLLYVANQLQAPDGGVYTQYNLRGGSIAPLGTGVTVAENGETTSLFALADYLWNNNAA